MPGQALASGIKKLVRQTCGVEAFIEFWADGGNVKHLAEGIGVTAPWLRTWFKKTAKKLTEKTGDDYYAMRAEALQEQSLEDAEDVPADRDEIQKTKLVIEQRHRIAAALDPQTWGEKAAPPINILSTGDLHLMAVSNPEVVRAAQRRMAQSPARKALPGGTEKSNGDQEAPRP